VLKLQVGLVGQSRVCDLTHHEVVGGPVGGRSILFKDHLLVRIVLVIDLMVMCVLRVMVVDGSLLFVAVLAGGAVLELLLLIIVVIYLC
jgi:hypothetical protein